VHAFQDDKVIRFVVADLQSDLHILIPPTYPISEHKPLVSKDFMSSDSNVQHPGCLTQAIKPGVVRINRHGPPLALPFLSIVTGALQKYPKRIDSELRRQHIDVLVLPERGCVGAGADPRRDGEGGTQGLSQPDRLNVGMSMKNVTEELCGQIATGRVSADHDLARVDARCKQMRQSSRSLL
jgi:hypothetical protein